MTAVNVRPSLSSSSAKSSGRPASAPAEEEHPGRHHAPARRVASGGHDRLPQHLAPLHHGPTTVGVRRTDEAQVAGGLHVHHLDEVAGVAPERHARDRDVPGVAAERVLDHLDAYPAGVEGAVATQGVVRRGGVGDDPQHVAPVVTHRFATHRLATHRLADAPDAAFADPVRRTSRPPAPEERELDVVQGEPQLGWFPVAFEAEAGIRPGHHDLAPPGACPVRVPRQLHATSATRTAERLTRTAWRRRRRRGGPGRHGDRRQADGAAMPDQRVDHVHEIVDIDQRVGQVFALHPLGPELHRALGVPPVGEAGHGVALSPGAVADHEPRETDRGVLRPPCLHQLVQCCLADGVGTQPGPGRRLRRADRGEVDGDTLRIGEVRESGVGHQRGADDVGVEDAPPRLGIHVDQGGERPDGRCVDKRVDSAQPCDRLVDRRPARLGAGHIAGQRHALGPSFLGGGFEPVRPARQQRRPGPPPGEPDADAAAEPTRCTNHDRPQFGSSRRVPGNDVSQEPEFRFSQLERRYPAPRPTARFPPGRILRR